MKHVSPLFLRRSGSVLTVSGRLTYTSNRSMEIEVLVDVSSLVEPEIGQYRAVSAFFVFISLDKYNRVMAVPPLKVSKAPAAQITVGLKQPLCWARFPPKHNIHLPFLVFLGVWDPLLIKQQILYLRSVSGAVQTSHVQVYLQSEAPAVCPAVPVLIISKPASYANM